MLNKLERPARAQVAQSAIAPKEATTPPGARITRLARRFGAARQSLVVAHDVTIATLALPIAFMLRESSVILPTGRLDYVLSALPLMALAALASTLLFGSYRAVWRYMGVPEIVRLAQFAAIAVLLFQVGHFLVDRLDGMPRSIPPMQFLVMMFAMLASRIAYGELLRWSEAAPTTRPAEPILLVGSGDGTALFIRMLGFRRQPDFEPVGILCDQVTTNRSIAGVPVLGDLADFERVAANLEVQGMAPAKIVITRPHHEFGPDNASGYAATDALIEQATARGIEIADLPDLMRFKDETPVSEPITRETLAADVYPRLKRSFDVLVSAAVLTTFAAFIATAALAVALFIQRPVMFVQVRPGLARKPFKLYKFRTMQDPVDSNGNHRTDAERTPLAGRILRRTRFDELPQFWNVLTGDMAIIGPRPLIRSDLDAMPDRGEARCRTKPGITGWAQVNGGHQLTHDEKLALDLYYLENASLTLDAQIVWRTVMMMLFGEKKNHRAIERAFAQQAAMGMAE